MAPLLALGHAGAMTASVTFGDVLRDWRHRRRLSQLDLALEADVSARHVSFVENGRSQPSRAMVLRLAAALEVPPREQNRLLVAAGLAPVYAERSLDDPGMTAVRAGVARVLAAYEPYPCLAVNRNWDVLQINSGAALLLAGVAPRLLNPPTRCASPCTRTAWHRGSVTSASGATTCSAGCAGRPRAAAHRSPSRCSPNWSPIPAERTMRRTSAAWRCPWNWPPPTAGCCGS